MHVIAPRRWPSRRRWRPDFKAYQQQVLKNAAVLAETLVSAACASSAAAPRAT